MMIQENFTDRKKLILHLMKEELYVPMKEKELAIFLQVPKENRESLREVLQQLLDEKEIQISKRGKYSIADKKTLQGVFVATQHGYGFVEVEGEEEDYFVAEKNVDNAMHGDTVEFEPIAASYKRGKRKEAVVVKVLERATNLLVGTFDKAKNRYGFVIPDNHRFNQDIFIPIEKSNGALDGHKVVVEITDYGSRSKSPEGKVVEILGHINDPGVDVLSIIKSYDLPVAFPERVMNQTARISDEVSEADMAGRTDLRNVTMVTIDGEDTKDLDDAVSISMEGDCYLLGVHIADVTNYVQENSALDREALGRGTSIYLADRVIPMLPHRLSNGICSLNENQDRLALSCLMRVDKNGEVIDHEIVETVIRTNRRMTYTAVNAILEDDDEELKKEYEELVPQFYLMRDLAHILREKRKKRGSIDFDIPETKLILDKEGHPIEIRPYERNTATKLIEDFMLLANETIAEHFFWQELPFVYRTHEKPDPEKIKKLAAFIRNFGYGIKIKNEEIHPKELQKLLARIEDTPEEALISRLTLRSMQRASYSTECTGHFGLACKYYCHFTSPIRRYPDLQIHRIIKDGIRGRLKEARIEHYHKILGEVAKQSGSRERLADEAERETEKLKKAEYMEDKIGEIYTGVISGITNWGIYVELPNTIEGLVHVSKITGDFYYYDENSYELIGEASGRRYKLGQTVSVCVNGVDKASRSVDFVLA